MYLSNTCKRQILAYILYLYTYETTLFLSKSRPFLTETTVMTTIFSGRAWYYQTCTEYGYYQTAPKSGTVFDVLEWLSVKFYVNICEKAFDKR